MPKFLISLHRHPVACVCLWLKDTVARAIKRTVSLTDNDEENKEDLNAEQTMILSGFYSNAAKLPPDPIIGHINPEVRSLVLAGNMTVEITTNNLRTG